MVAQAQWNIEKVAAFVRGAFSERRGNGRIGKADGLCGRRDEVHGGALLPQQQTQTRKANQGMVRANARSTCPPLAQIFVDFMYAEGIIIILWRRLIYMKAREFDKKFDDGGDISQHLDISKAKRPEQEQKRVNVDFPVWMIQLLDKEARRLGVPRQSIIKVWVAERLEKAS
jgi:hypothetical protein